MLSDYNIDFSVRNKMSSVDRSGVSSVSVHFLFRMTGEVVSEYEVR